MFLTMSDSFSSCHVLLYLSSVSGTIDLPLLEMHWASIGSFYLFRWFYFLHLPHDSGQFSWVWSLLLSLDIKQLIHSLVFEQQLYIRTPKS